MNEIISSIFSNHNGRKTRNLLPEENWKIHRCVEINLFTFLNKMEGPEIGDFVLLISVLQVLDRVVVIV